MIEKTYFHRIVFCSLLSYFCHVEAALSKQWLYVNPLNPGELFSIERDPDAFGMNDIRYAAVYCSPENEYICIKSYGFDFFVPRDPSRLVDTWSVEGAEYRVTFRKNVMLFGIKDVIYYIDKSQQKGNSTIRFLYSESRGLIGMGGFSKSGSAIFLLDVKCGFGAPPSC